MIEGHGLQTTLIQASIFSFEGNFPHYAGYGFGIRRILCEEKIEK